MTKSKEKAQGIWATLWEEYKKEWKAAWEKYKTIIGPFIKGTASYIWLLVAGLIEVLTKGLYESGCYLVKKLLEWIEKI